jgi:hypothetical protein
MIIRNDVEEWLVSKYLYKEFYVKIEENHKIHSKIYSL